MPLLLAFAGAAAVGLVFQRWSVPGGLVVGAMLGAATVSLVGGGPPIVVPGALKTAAFLVLGTAIGVTVSRATVLALRDALLPAVLAAVLLILAGVAIAYLLRTLNLAPAGDVLATSPGALSTVSALAAERGTGAAEVALFHTVRVVLVLVSLPGLLGLLPDDP